MNNFQTLTYFCTQKEKPLLCQLVAFHYVKKRFSKIFIYIFPEKETTNRSSIKQTQFTIPVNAFTQVKAFLAICEKNI